MTAVPSRDEMDAAFHRLIAYTPRTTQWFRQAAASEIDIRCEKFVRCFEEDPDSLINPIVGPIPQEERAFAPRNAVVVLSYEVQGLGIFREYVTPAVVPGVIAVLVRMIRDEMDLVKKDQTIQALRHLRSGFWMTPGTMPEATEGLRAEDCLSYSLALSVIRQAVNYEGMRPEIAEFYNAGDLHMVYRKGVDILGEPVANADMVTGSLELSPPGMISPHSTETSHFLLRLVAFLCEEAKVSMSLG